MISCEYVQCHIDFGILEHNDTDHRCAKTGTTLQFSIPPDDGKFDDEEIVFLRTCEAARSRKNSSKEASTQEASGKLAEELARHAEKILFLHVDTKDLQDKLAGLNKPKKNTT